MKNLKIKIITGYRDDQSYTIDAEEAHKAYYLFMNPEKRGIFDNGVAIIGKNIQGIEPDYQATLDYNPTYKLQNDDWNDIRRRGIDNDLRAAIIVAKEVAGRAEVEPELIGMPLQEAKQKLLK